MNDIAALITDNLDIWASTIERKKAAGRGRGKSKKLSLYGVEKLRALILDLAVRGKLVPQDPGDEPASELLKRIRAEKEELKKKTKDRRIKLEQDPNPDLLPFILPNGWAVQSFENLFLFIDYRGNTPKKTSNGVPLITAKNIRMGFLNREPREYISHETYETWMTRGFPRIGDLFFTTEAPLANICLNDIEEPFALAQRAICLQPFGEINTNNLMIILMSEQMQKLIDNSATGMTAKGIKAAKLKKIPIPIPPLAEQKRIVAKVDELMALCDALEAGQGQAIEAHELLVKTLLATLVNSQNAMELAENWSRISSHFHILFTTQNSISQLKQTILQLAVMGKLVPQDPNDEPASKLLKRIKAEKAKLIAEKKIKKGKPLPPIADEEKPFDLPQGWEWSHVGNVFQVSSGTSFKKEYEKDKGEYPYIKVADMNLPENKLIITTSSRFIDPNNKMKRNLIPKNSIVFPKRGGAIATNKKKLVLIDIFADLNIMAITAPMHISLEYSFKWLLGIDLALLNTGTSVPQINHQDIEPLLFPLPPLAEQKRIVARVDELMALCDQLTSRLTDASTLQKQLADTIIKQATA